MQRGLEAAARTGIRDSRARAAPAAPAADTARHRRAVRRTALVCALVAAAFYFGFIVMMLVRATK